MVKGFNLLLAFLDSLSKLVSLVEIFADISVFPKLFDVFQLFFDFNELLVEYFLLVFEFLGELSFPLLDDPLCFPDGIFDSLRPLLETPKAAEGNVVYLIEVLLKG